ncbi:MAG: hypothetical protein H6618_06350 [Deltaproteobacteria bacterium]|nr:hypothetical protein [Deltaproteobacteria bacterium]
MSRAEYYREYRRRKNRQINSKRRDNRRKQTESVQVPLFDETGESAANPAKDARQTSGKYKQQLAEESLSNLRELFPEEAEIREELFAVASGDQHFRGPDRPRLYDVAEKSGPARTTRQAPYTFTANVASTAAQQPEDPKVATWHNTEMAQQRNNETAQHVAQQSRWHNTEMAQQTRKPLSVLGATMAIVTLMVANTFFLIMEQISLYQALGYSAGMAGFVAVLTECSLVLLSGLGGWTQNIIWRGILYSACTMMLMVVLQLLDASASHRSSTIARHSEQSKNLRKELIALEALRDPIIARISSLDPNHYRSEIDRLTAKLESRPDGLSYKIADVRDQLARLSSGGLSGSSAAMIWQRRAIIAINLILSAFLGFLWRRKEKPGLWTRWASRPVEI